MPPPRCRPTFYAIESRFRGLLRACHCRSRLLSPDDDPGEHLNTVVRDAEGMQPRNGCLSAHFHDLHLANHRIPIEALKEPQHSVRNGEDRIPFSLRGVILTDEKRRRFPACERTASCCTKCCNSRAPFWAPRQPGPRSKGIDDHHPGARRFDFLNDACQELLQRAGHHLLAQIDVADRLIHAGHIEEGEPLLIAQHLERGFADDGEVQRGPIGTGEGEHDLLRERRFPRAWSAGNEIEGELRQTPTQDLVESRNARGKSGSQPVRSLIFLKVASEKHRATPSQRRAVKGSREVTSNVVSV